jgi:hypothetical protein
MQFQICYPPSVECFDPYILHCLTTSVEDKTNEEPVHIFPVPAQNEVNIQLNMNAVAEVRIINLVGVEVFRQNVEVSGSFTLPVFIGDLPGGMYLINIATGTEIFTRKLTVNR